MKHQTAEGATEVLEVHDSNFLKASWDFRSGRERVVSVNSSAATAVTCNSRSPGQRHSAALSRLPDPGLPGLMSEHPGSFKEHHITVFCHCSRCRFFGRVVGWVWGVGGWKKGRGGGGGGGANVT